jgi:hypothetical protein
MKWPEFLDAAYEQIGTHPTDVILGYRISTESRYWVILVCEMDWSILIDRMREKIQTVRTRAVTMELKNTVSKGSTQRYKKTYHLVTEETKEGALRIGEEEG